MPVCGDGLRRLVNSDVTARKARRGLTRSRNVERKIQNAGGFAAGRPCAARRVQCRINDD